MQRSFQGTPNPEVATMADFGAREMSVMVLMMAGAGVARPVSGNLARPVAAGADGYGVAAMSSVDYLALAPHIVLAAAIMLSVLVVSFWRNHGVAMLLTVVGFAAALAALFPALQTAPWTLRRFSLWTDTRCSSMPWCLSPPW